MPLTTTFAGASIRGLGFFTPSTPIALNGMELLTPTSIAKTGPTSTATINANGSVTYAYCDTLSLNGVFSSTYDNYMVVVRGTEIGQTDVGMRLRASGTDNVTASSYTYQRLLVDGLTEQGVRSVSTVAIVATAAAVTRNGWVLDLWGPFLAQPTAFRSTTVSDISNGQIQDYAGTHNQSTSYDGITLSGISNPLHGLLAVYGLVD